MQTSVSRVNDSEPWRLLHSGRGYWISATKQRQTQKHHRLRGNASTVLTATHHSYGSPRLSDFFFGSRLEVRPPTDFDAKWLKRRGFTQGWYFCSKNRYFSYSLISRAPKRAKFHKFLDLENFSLDLAFNIGGLESEHPLFFIRAQ